MRILLRISRLALFFALVLFGVVVLSILVRPESIELIYTATAEARQENMPGLVALYLAVYALCVFLCFPVAGFFPILAGLLFGGPGGVVAAALGATIGAGSLCLLLQRFTLPYLQRGMESWRGRLAAGFEANELSFLFFIRLVPAIPFFVSNLVPAIFPVNFWKYILATGIGVIPGAIPGAFFGAALEKMIVAGVEPRLDMLKSADLLAPFLMLAALPLFPVLLKRFGFFRSQEIRSNQ